MCSVKHIHSQCVDSDANTRDDGALISMKSRSQTPPFLLTLEIFNRNVHNCLVDSGALLNVIPYLVSKKLDAEP